MFVPPKYAEERALNILHDAGVAPKEAYKRTGSFVGVDGRLRTEISDAKSKFQPHVAFQEENAARDDVANALYLLERNKRFGHSSLEETFKDFNENMGTTPWNRRVLDLAKSTPSYELAEMKKAADVSAYPDTTLGKILRHDDLYKREPWLRDMPVRIETIPGEGGHYSPSKKEIVIGDHGSNSSKANLDKLVS